MGMFSNLSSAEPKQKKSLFSNLQENTKSGNLFADLEKAPLLTVSEPIFPSSLAPEPTGLDFLKEAGRGVPGVATRFATALPRNIAGAAGVAVDIASNIPRGLAGLPGVRAITKPQEQEQELIEIAKFIQSQKRGFKEFVEAPLPDPKELSDTFEFLFEESAAGTKPPDVPARGQNVRDEVVALKKAGKEIPPALLLKAFVEFDEEQAEVERKAAAFKEGKETFGVSGIRDVARTGLAVSPLLTGGATLPLAAGLVLGVPGVIGAAAEATETEGALEEAGSRLAGLIEGLDRAETGEISPGGEFLAETVAEVVENLPELAFLGLGGRAIRRQGKPLRQRPELEIPGTKELAKLTQQRAVEKSIQRQAAKKEGVKRKGLGRPLTEAEALSFKKTGIPGGKPTITPDTATLAQKFARPLVRKLAVVAARPGVLGKIAKVGLTPIEGSLAGTIGSRVTQAIGATMEKMISKNFRTRAREILTPIKDILPREVLESFDNALGLQALGMTQAIALSNRVSRLSRVQKRRLGEFLEKAPRKPLQKSQLFPEELPTEKGGPRGQLPDTDAAIQARMAHYLDEADGLVNDLLRGKEHAELRVVAKETIALQRVGEDLAGIDTRGFTQGAVPLKTRKELAKLREAKKAALDLIPVELRALVKKEFVRKSKLMRERERLQEEFQKGRKQDEEGQQPLTVSRRVREARISSRLDEIDLALQESLVKAELLANIQKIQETLRTAERKASPGTARRIARLQTKLEKVRKKLPTPEKIVRPGEPEVSAPARLAEPTVSRGQPLAGKAKSTIRQKLLKPGEKLTLEKPTKGVVRAFKPKREIRRTREIEPVIPPVEAPLIKVQRGVVKVPARLEQGKIVALKDADLPSGEFPSGAVRPVVLKPGTTTKGKGSLVDAEGEPARQKQRDLIKKTRGLETIIDNDLDYTQRGQSVVAPTERLIQRTEATRSDADVKLEAKQVKASILDQAGEDIVLSDLRKLAEGIEKNIVKGRTHTPKQMAVLFRTRDKLRTKLKTVPELGESYAALVFEEQRNFLRGGKGHLRKEYIETLNAEADALIEAVNQNAAPPANATTKKDFAERTGHLTARGTDVRLHPLQSPTMPLFNELTGNFNLAASKNLMASLKKTAFVDETLAALPSDHPTLTAFRTKGWKQLPKSKLLGELSDQWVDRRIWNALELPRQLDKGGAFLKNVSHLNNWMAANLAARNPASFMANVMGTQWALFVDAGIPLHKMKEVIFKLGAQAANDPEFAMAMRRLRITTLTNRQLEPQVGGTVLGRKVVKVQEAIEKKLEGTAAGEWILDSAKRKNFLEYEKEFTRLREAQKLKTGDEKLIFQMMTDTIDLGTTMTRKVFEPLIGKEAATLLDQVKLGEVYSDFEFMARAGAIRYLMKEKGMDLNSAARKVNKALVDYTNVSPAVAQLRQFSGGLGNRFMQFQASMAVRGMELATSYNPMTLARFWSVPLAMEGISQVARDAQRASIDNRRKEQKLPALTDKEYANIREQDITGAKSWQRYPSRLFFTEVWDEKRQKMNLFNAQRLNPYGYNAQIATDFIERFKGRDVDVSPIRTVLQPALAVHPILEQLANYRFFYGRPITDTQFEDQRQFSPFDMRDRMDHMLESYMPVQIGRNVSGFARKIRGSDSLSTNNLRNLRLSNSDMIFRMLTGIRLSEMDTPLSQERFFKEMARFEKDVEAGKIFKKPDVSPEQFPAVTRMIAKELRLRLQDLPKKIKEKKP